MARVTVAADAADLAVSAAGRIATLLRDTRSRGRDARICLTGGRTARMVYEALARTCAARAHALDLHHVEFFWGDERHVPPDHPDSNFGMAFEAWLRPCGVRAEGGAGENPRVHRMRGELPAAAEAATEYDAVLRRYVRADAPLFDVMLLGLGEDAHIASIFPGSPLLTRGPRSGPPAAGEGTTPLAAAVWASHLNAWRITLTPDAVLNAGSIVVISDGAGKAAAVHAALNAPEDVERAPAQLLRAAADRVEWWLDEDAASKLP